MKSFELKVPVILFEGIVHLLNA